MQIYLSGRKNMGECNEKLAGLQRVGNGALARWIFEAKDEFIWLRELRWSCVWSDESMKDK